ncbi:DUF6634 family protein [Falsiroseomonas oryzae]|uniref:DUF6634 family protein n=1 Tax=Falsiroseomonas oryzae TaxID=2766473 RepID=UPI0022EA34CE|nr:DUF6634 family protein [Roseomonas sp. MO-31]
MTIIIGPNGIIEGAVAGEIQRLAGLLHDLRRIAGGLPPDPGHLRSAPQLDGWSITSRPSACLTGVVSGHPTASGPRIITSDLWVIAPTAGWARTMSRLYRLGDPACPTDITSQAAAR